MYLIKWDPSVQTRLVEKYNQRLLSNLAFPMLDIIE